MRLFFLLLRGLNFGCAYRYALTPVHQPICECERIVFVRDTLVCYTASARLKLSVDSLLHIDRRARLGGTVVFGGIGASFGTFAGIVIGALFAWSSLTKTPEPLSPYSDVSWVGGRLSCRQIVLGNVGHKNTLSDEPSHRRASKNRSNLY